MIDLLQAWVIFPVLFVLLCSGLGLGVLRLYSSGKSQHLLLAFPLGVAVVLTVGSLLSEIYAPAITGLLAVLAVLGYWFSRKWWSKLVINRALPVSVAALMVVLLYGLPVLTTGHPTFLGYIKLDDTATWLAFTDQVMHSGRDFSHLQPSSHEATVQINVQESSYPLGAFVPLGVGAQLSGQDAAWVFYPFLALMAVALALTLAWLVRSALPVAQQRWSDRGLWVGAFSACSSLLLAYAFWGGIKELEGALLLALIAASGQLILANRSLWSTLPLVVSCLALLTVLGLGGGVWLAPIILAVAGVHLYRYKLKCTLKKTGFALLLAAPVLATYTYMVNFGLSTEVATSDIEVANLGAALSKWQVLGVWPSSDFRFRPELNGVEELIFVAVLAIIALAAVKGGWVALQKRAWGLLLYGGGGLISCLAVVSYASPWIDGKSMAIASPIFLALAGVGLFSIPHKWIRRSLALIIAISILVCAVMQYQDVYAAPYKQLNELEQISSQIVGPSLMTEYQPYGVRHFLRKSGAEGASELRRSIIPLLTGQTLQKGLYADLDQFDLSGILAYRTLVLRKNPSEARPPSIYNLQYDGEYYQLWTRPELIPAITHIPAGLGLQQSGKIPCSQLRDLAQTAQAQDGLLATYRRPELTVAAINAGQYPADWEIANTDYLAPISEGQVTFSINVPSDDDYVLWLGGSFAGTMKLLVDGQELGSETHQLNNSGQYVSFGTHQLSKGEHQVTLDYSGPNWRPGSNPYVSGIGPFVAEPAGALEGPVSYYNPKDYKLLCNQQLDWAEAVAGQLP